MGKLIKRSVLCAEQRRGNPGHTRYVQSCKSHCCALIPVDTCKDRALFILDREQQVIATLKAIIDNDGSTKAKNSIEDLNYRNKDIMIVIKMLDVTQESGKSFLNDRFVKMNCAKTLVKPAFSICEQNRRRNYAGVSAPFGLHSIIHVVAISEVSGIRLSNEAEWFVSYLEGSSKTCSNVI